MRSSIFASLLFLLCATFGLSQEAAPKSTASATRDQKGLEVLLDRISSLPPEYKADLGFTLLDAAGTSLSPAQKRSLLGDIFHSATKTRYPFGLTGASTRDLAAFLLANSRLDALDIQAGAVERALPSTPQFADQLFEEMKVEEDRASCVDASVENISPFYVTSAKIIEDRRITAISGEDKGLYLLNLIVNMKIPAEIDPLAQLITRVPLTVDQMGQIEVAFDSALNKITASDREMSAAEQDGNLTRSVEQLSIRLAQSGVSSGRLLTAYRSFLVRSLTPESCSDRTLDRAVVARNFNALLLDPLLRLSDLAPLTAAQLESGTRGASAPNDNAPINEQINSKLYRIAAAQVAGTTQEYRNGQPRTIVPESSDVDDVINYAVSPQPTANECAVCYFEARGALLNMLVQLLPPGAELEKAVYAQTDYLSFSDMQKDEPVAWLHLFKELLNVSRRMDMQTEDAIIARANRGTVTPLGAPSGAASEIRRILRGSTDPIISAYLSADDLLHLPFLAGEPY